MNKGIRYTDEFKRAAVAQVVEGGYSVSEVAERLGISTKSLYTWKAQFAKSPHERAEVLDQAAELRRLKRELARVTEESTIPKTATTYFARASQRGTNPSASSQTHLTPPTNTSASNSQTQR